MPVSTQIADARAGYFSDSPTAIDIRPDSKGGFFGEDGLSFRDVLDAINPLNHIPIISGVVESLTGHEASTGSKLIGGALLGGPIGFVASLAGEIYKSETGQSVANAVYAAVADESPVAVAAADTNEEVAAVASQAEESIEAANITMTSEKEALMASLDPATQAALMANTQVPQSESETEPKQKSRVAPANATRALLDLYGASPASAHASYQSAQMRPYLADVTVSKVL